MRGILISFLLLFIFSCKQNTAPKDENLHLRIEINSIVAEYPKKNTLIAAKEVDSTVKVFTAYIDSLIRLSNKAKADTLLITKNYPEIKQRFVLMQQLVFSVLNTKEKEGISIENIDTVKNNFTERYNVSVFFMRVANMAKTTETVVLEKLLARYPIDTLSVRRKPIPISQ